MSAVEYLGLKWISPKPKFILSYNLLEIRYYFGIIRVFIIRYLLLKKHSYLINRNLILKNQEQYSAALLDRALYVQKC